MSDLNLLAAEIDLLWGAHDGPELVAAVACDGIRARVNRTVPTKVARAAIRALETAVPGASPETPPASLELWRLRLEDTLGTAIVLAHTSGPSFLVPDQVAFPSRARLIRSADTADVKTLRAANPGNWAADEWSALLDGQLEGWAMAVAQDQVVSICHTAMANTQAAEAGVWTHPNFRGHGFAAACTAAWAELMRPTGRSLLYSTSSSNTASRKVAARLALRPIGWLWQLARAVPAPGWSDRRLRGRPSGLDGSGLYAAASIAAGEAVCGWGGARRVSDAELRAIALSGRRYRSVAIDENCNLVWGADEVPGAGPCGARHACDSNLWLLDSHTLGARRDIAVGEELTLDYALASVAPEWRMECHCGELLCRRVVTGNDWRQPDLQHRYAGHFSPFINARIASLAGSDQ
jgi:RimJ/RimL family protein N-acetyltransferase